MHPGPECVAMGGLAGPGIARYQPGGGTVQFRYRIATESLQLCSESARSEPHRRRQGGPVIKLCGRGATRHPGVDSRAMVNPAEPGIASYLHVGEGRRPFSGRNPYVPGRQNL